MMQNLINRILVTCNKVGFRLLERSQSNFPPVTPAQNLVETIPLLLKGGNATTT